jgi:hypothetical protein
MTRKLRTYKSARRRCRRWSTWLALLKRLDAEEERMRCLARHLGRGAR